MVIDDKDNIKSAPFHNRWSDILLNGKDNFAIQAFRGSAKSTYSIRTFLLYQLRFPTNDLSYIVLVKQNETLAGSKLKEVWTEFLANRFLSDNIVKVIEQSTSAFCGFVRY